MRVFTKLKVLLIASLLLTIFSLKTKAQTTLYAGDIAFIGANVNSSAADTFAIVLLKDIAQNTEIGFSDGCYQDTSTKLHLASTKVDWYFTWQPPSGGLKAGDVVKFWTSSTGDVNQGGQASASLGTITAGTGLNLKNNGDQVFAFQGISLIDTTVNYIISPNRYLAAIHLNVNFATTDANWDAGTYGLQQSELPDSLTTGSEAIRLYTGTNTEVTNGYLSSHTLSLDKTVINNLANWTRGSSAYDPTVPIRVTWSGSWDGTPSSTLPVVIQSSSAPGTFTGYDVRVDAGYTLTINTGMVASVYGDLLNYGTVSAGGTSSELRFYNTTDTSELFGNALAFEGVVRVASSAVLKTNDLLTLNAGNANSYGQIMGSGSFTGTITGNITASYYIDGSSEGWRSICSPLDGATLAQLNDDVPLNFGTPNSNYTNIFQFDESSSTPHWTTPSGLSASMDNGAYAVYIRSAILPLTLDITGTAHANSDYTISGLTLTGSSTDTSGWHIIRNPWVSGYYWDGSVANVQGAAAYMYDKSAGTYTSFDNIFDGIIPPFQAITIKVTSNNVDVTLSNSSRNPAIGTNFFNKTLSVNNYIGLTVKNLQTDVTDVARFYTDAVASNTFDQLDGVKKMNDAEAPSIYFATNGTKLYKEVWQDIPLAGIDLPVNFTTTSEGDYQLTADLQNIEYGVDVYLEDLLNQKLYDISKGTVKFSVSANDAAERFVLHIRKSGTSTGVKETEAANYFIGSNNTNISIASTVSETITVEVTDLMGRIISNNVLEAAAGTANILPALNTQTGYYVVRVTGNSGMQVAKVFLK